MTDVNRGRDQGLKCSGPTSIVGKQEEGSNAEDSTYCLSG